MSRSLPNLEIVHFVGGFGLKKKSPPSCRPTNGTYTRNSQFEKTFGRIYQDQRKAAETAGATGAGLRSR